MTLDFNGQILGVTGSFGSGCSTLALALEGFGYKRISLSSEVRTEFQISQGEKKTEKTISKGDDRRLLQDFGNRQRLENGSDYWAKKAVGTAQKTFQSGLPVFDGIRNSKELEFLRNTFPNFLLITVWCPQRFRFDRVREEYGGDWSVFEEDDKRDCNEEIAHGQEVQLCVDNADIVIRNDDNHTPAAAARHLKNKIGEYIHLIQGTEVRPPHHDEVAMAIAYTSALRSQCIKRTVGAAITSHSGVLISSGYNENPEPMDPCVRAYGYCFKDAQLREHIGIMVKRRPECPNPKCKVELKSLESLRDGFKCVACGYNLVRAYAPDRGMQRCTAVHAEMAAILNAGGKDLRDKVLYTTTFPCSQCARQIAYVGIKKVVYVEPYPDPDSESFMRDNCKIILQMFEGVKARAYERIFTKVRLQNEKRYSLTT
ncbi:MAG: hypothetical protein KC643_30990 [Nitrospira sp.]|nr:hypothetical protein [Nitrospira sp.]